MSEVRISAMSTAPGMSPEEFVAYCARVSNPSNQNNKETAAGLIKYLIKHKHWSPLEMVSLTMEIKTTRDIARQILRHRSFSFQEFSQRYAVAEDFEYREARLQDKKNRQNSIETNDHELQRMWEDHQRDALIAAKKAYTWALSIGMAKEQARAVLPEGMTKSTMYMSGTLRSWIHYYQLRAEEGTQKEHRIIADQVGVALSEHFPNIMAVLDELEGDTDAKTKEERLREPEFGERSESSVAYESGNRKTYYKKRSVPDFKHRVQHDETGEDTSGS